MQTRLSRRVFALWVLVWRPRVKGAVRAADSARPASLHQYPAQSNPADYPVVTQFECNKQDCHSGANRRSEPGIHEYQFFQGLQEPVFLDSGLVGYAYAPE